MRAILLTLTLATLAACGADGAPEAPASKAETSTGLTVSGCAKIGLSYGTNSSDRSGC